ncbi:chemotaxis protein CheX [Marinicrinis sediminis]|uniref:Chemotaxis protein CheX n=1 Tax=Marinicrinis sediminis TaxID=1652465 RepID=A0ABW5RCZ7_9BACL
MAELKQEHLQAVLGSIGHVLQGHLQYSQIEYGDVSKEASQTLTVEQIAVVVGVTGDVQGDLIVTMREDMVKEIIGRMFGGMEIATIDEMGWSAYGEFGNWLGAGCCTSLSDCGLNVNITPPMISEGSTRLHSSNHFISIPFKADNHAFSVHISIQP